MLNQSTEDDPHQEAAFQIGHVVIVESLTGREHASGKELSEYLMPLFADSNFPVKVSFDRVVSAISLRSLIEDLTDYVQTTGDRPILHIECHGDEIDGLVFSDGSELGWPDLCDALAPLNRATGFNLVVVLAACFGAAIRGDMRLSRGAPACALLGPTSLTDGSEMTQQFRTFYRGLATTLNVDRAIEAMHRQPMGSGRMDFLHVSQWFSDLVTVYLNEQEQPKVHKAAALRIYQGIKSHRPELTIGDVKRHFVRSGIADAMRRFYHSFFMTTELPENLKRFELVEQGLAERLGRFANH